MNNSEDITIDVNDPEIRKELMNYMLECTNLRIYRIDGKVYVMNYYDITLRGNRPHDVLVLSPQEYSQFALLWGNTNNGSD